MDRGEHAVAALEYLVEFFQFRSRVDVLVQGDEVEPDVALLSARSHKLHHPRDSFHAQLELVVSSVVRVLSNRFIKARSSFIAAKPAMAHED